MGDADGLAQRLSGPCPRIEMPQTVGLSYKYAKIYFIKSLTPRPLKAGDEAISLLSLIFDSLSLLSRGMAGMSGRLIAPPSSFRRSWVLGTLGRCGPECGMELRQLPSRPSNQVCPRIMDVRVE